MVIHSNVLAQPQTHAWYQCSPKSYENVLAQPRVDNVDKQQTDTGQVMVTCTAFLTDQFSSDLAARGPELPPESLDSSNLECEATVRGGRWVFTKRGKDARGEIKEKQGHWPRERRMANRDGRGDNGTGRSLQPMPQGCRSCSFAYNSFVVQHFSPSPPSLMLNRRQSSAAGSESPPGELFFVLLALVSLSIVKWARDTASCPQMAHNCARAQPPLSRVQHSCLS
jgi:hypothetical protein